MLHGYSVKTLAKELNLRVTDVLALAPKNDPFAADTPAIIARGRWFADVYSAAGYGPSRAPHLRRVHYWIVSQDPPLTMTDGKPYTNTQACWSYLGEAAKAARYCGLVPVDGITDNKNPNPYLNAMYEADTRPDYEIDVPQLAAPGVMVYMPQGANAQPYHLEVWCEKSTMNDVLGPICQRYYANLVTFEGESSITAVCVGLMNRIREAGKPARIFYISDFDPAGNSMPVAMSRKLEWSILQEAQAYNVRVRPLALTRDQVETYRLPRIPIKETETRAAKFEEAFGAGAVELDALEALYPGVLADIVNAALRPYYSAEAERLMADYRRILYDELRAKVDAITARYQPQIDALAEMLAELRAVELDAAPAPIEPLSPTVYEAEDWLYDSGRRYMDQIAYYKAHKAGDAPQEE